MPELSPVEIGAFVSFLLVASVVVAVWVWRSAGKGNVSW